MGLPAVAVSLIVAAASTAANIGISYLMRPKGRQDPIDVGKYDDIRVTGSEYGVFIPRIWGKVRVGGNIVWSDGITHRVQNYQSQGGKGVPQAPAERIHTYTISLGMVFCANQIDSWGRFWADADLIQEVERDSWYTFSPDDFTLSGSYTIVDPDATAQLGKSVSFAGAASVTIDTSIINNPSKRTGDPDEVLTEKTTVTIAYKSSGSKTVTLTGYNGASVVSTQTKTFADTGGNWVNYDFIEFDGFLTSVKYENASAAPPDLNIIGVAKYWKSDQTTNLIEGLNPSGIADPFTAYDSTSSSPVGFYSYAPVADAQGTYTITSPPRYYGFRMYTGTTDQLADSAFIDYLDTKYGVGVGEDYATAYRGLTMGVFEDYYLNRGRVPNFTIELINNDNKANDVIATMIEDIGLTSADYDLSLTAGFEFVGYIENSKSSRRSHIETLGRYFGFRLAEIDGKITTVKDYFNALAVLDTDLLRATNLGEEPIPFDASIKMLSETEKPQQVQFSFLNPLLDYHNETANAFLFADVSTIDSVQYSFPIVDTLDNARNNAERFLLKTWSETKEIEFQGMPALAKYAIGDVVTLPIKGVNYRVRIEKKTMALPLGVVKFQGVIIEDYNPSEIENATNTTQLSPINNSQFNSVSIPRNVEIIPIISKPIRRVDTGRLGVYVAVCGYGVGSAETFGIYRELGTDNYVLNSVQDVPSTIGTTDGTLGSHADANTNDTTNTLDILFNDVVSLESLDSGTGFTQLDRYPQLNLIRVGSEWIQFRTATIQSVPANSIYKSKWRISNFKRGRFGTSAAMSSHSASEKSVLFTNALKFIDLETGDVGQTVKFKGISGGQDIDAATAVSFTFNPISSYTVTNDTTDRAYDANSTSINELSDVVATIIDDLNL